MELLTSLPGNVGRVLPFYTLWATRCPHLWDTGGPHLWDTDGPHLWDTGGPHLWDTHGPHLWDTGCPQKLCKSANQLFKQF